MAHERPITADTVWPEQGTWTYDDWLHLPADGTKYEVLGREGHHQGGSRRRVEVIMREPIGVEALRRADVAAARALMEFAERQPEPAPWSAALVRFPVCTPKVLGVWPNEEPWIPAINVWALYHGVRVPATDGSVPPENTPAAVYLAHVGRTIAASTRRYIEAALREPFRIWEVVHTDPGRFVSLKDLLTGREAMVYDRSFSAGIARWDLVCAHIVGWNDIHVMSAVAPYHLPAGSREGLARGLANIKAATADDLLVTQIAVLQVFGDELGRYATRPAPNLTNTDSESLVWAKAEYAFDPSERDAIVRALRRDTMLHSDPPGPDDPIEEFAWLKKSGSRTPGSTHLGSVRVGPADLSLECNSAERSRRLRERIATRLGDRVRFVRATEEAMNLDAFQAMAPKGGPDESGSPEIDESVPEIAAILDQMHMKWLDGKVPALGGVTPRKAVRTKEGRERVIALLHEFENMDSHMPKRPYQFDYNRLRKELGLPDE